MRGTKEKISNVLRKLFSIMCIIIDGMIIFMIVISALFAACLFIIIMWCMINNNIQVDIVILNKYCLTDYIAWFGVFCTISIIPSLTIIISEYHAANVSQSEIEKDLSNGIKSFIIKEIPLGITSDDYKSYYQAIFEEDGLNKGCIFDDNSNKLKTILNEHKLRDYRYIIEIEFKSNLSDMFKMNVLYAYFRFFDIDLKRFDDIKILTYDSKSGYDQTRSCVYDGAVKEKIVVFVSKDSPSVYNINNLVNSTRNNVTSYRKNFVIVINFYPRKGKRGLFRYRLFPLIRTIYMSIYNQMAFRRAMRLELELGEVRQNFEYGNAFQYLFTIKNTTFTLMKNIGKNWKDHIKKSCKSQSKYAEIERHDFIDNAIKHC